MVLLLLLLLLVQLFVNEQLNPSRVEIVGLERRLRDRRAALLPVGLAHNATAAAAAAAVATVVHNFQDGIVRDAVRNERRVRRRGGAPNCRRRHRGQWPRRAVLPSGGGWVVVRRRECRSTPSCQPCCC